MSHGYYRFPTLHSDRLVFVSEDDLWAVPTAGGVARRLTANLGAVSAPFFSPDGATLAFTGREEGHAEVYVMDAEGGPARVDEGIASALEVSVRTIERVRQRFVEQGLAAALLPKPSARLYARKLDGEQEAHLLALACTRPPEGKARWSLRLLAERMVELEHVDGLSHEIAASIFV